MITIIALVGRHRIVAEDFGLPRPREDVRNFLENTLSLPVIYGRKTFDRLDAIFSVPVNIVLTRNPEWVAAGVTPAGSINEAMRLALQDSEDVAVLGGGEVFREFMPLADRVILTEVDSDVKGPDQFPRMMASDWRLDSRSHHHGYERSVWMCHAAKPTKRYK